MRAAVKLIEEKKVQAAKVVTHILGLNAAGETTLELPAVGGGKKLVYTGKYLPLTSLTQIQDQALGRRFWRVIRGFWRVIRGSGPVRRSNTCSPMQRQFPMINRAT